MDQLWDSDFVLPWVDGGHTWINYEIYSVLNFLLENWRKKTSRWSVFSFSSSLLNQLIDIPWCVFSLYIYPSRHFDAVLFSLSLVRAGTAYESIPYASEKKKKKILYASRISLALAKSDREDTSYKGFGTMDPSVVAAVPEGLRKVVEENTAKTSLGDAEHTSSKQPTIKPSTTQTQNVHERRQKDKGRKPRRRALGAILFRSLKNPCNHL